MIIVSLANKNYKDRLLLSMKQSKRFGYDTIPYDIGGLGFGKKYTINSTILALNVKSKAHICLSKPAIMLDAFDEADETLMYLDSDAFLIDNIDEVDTDDYDIGVTYQGGEHRTFINAGVLFIRQTEKARKFLEMWIDRVDAVTEVMERIPKKRIGDNILLNELVFSYVTMGGYLKNKVHLVDDIRVKFFDASVYNNIRTAFNTKPVPDTTKVIHIAGGSYERFKEVIRIWGQ